MGLELATDTTANIFRLFGGFDDKKDRFNELCVFDCALSRWRRVKLRGKYPSPVYLHTAVAHWDNM